MSIAALLIPTNWGETIANAAINSGCLMQGVLQAVCFSNHGNVCI